MPKCGSQVILCDMPIRFDSYIGCLHLCAYCFTLRKQDLSNIRVGETPASVRKFIEGKRTEETNWCDFEQPLHWGGLADPFERMAEAKYGNSLAILELLAETQYPVVFSTKSTLVVEEPYASLIQASNIIGQVSMVGPSYDRIEPHAPPFAERLAMLPRLAEITRRVVIRSQPYVPGMEREIIEAMPVYADAGVFGITLEGLKRGNAKKGYVKLGADFVHPLSALRRPFERIREAAHKHGIKFYCAENRLRLEMSDNVSCCGAGDGLENFGRTNVANLNHLLDGDDERIEYTPAMLKKGSGLVFKAMVQTTLGSRSVQGMSFKEAMELAKRTKGIREVMGLPLARPNLVDDVGEGLSTRDAFMAEEMAALADEAAAQHVPTGASDAASEAATALLD